MMEEDEELNEDEDFEARASSAIDRSEKDDVQKLLYKGHEWPL